MPRKQSPEKLVQRLIAEALRSYLLAAKNRRKALEYCDTAFDVNRWEAKGPQLSRLAATLARVCDSISHELQNLYAIEDRLRNATDKGLHIVIEHVESPWRTEPAQSANRENTSTLHESAPTPHQPPDTGQKEVSP
jgi:hypothetical protein